MAGSMASVPFAVPLHLTHLNLAELKQLCNERELKTTGNKTHLITRMSKHETQAKVYDGFATASSAADLVALLESADKARTFHPFVQLPAELRNRIYRYATASDPSVALVRPRVPAICQASSQLRSESLPIHYGVNCFAIQLRAAVYARRPQHRVKLLLESRVDARDVRWLKMVKGAGTAQHLRRLLVAVVKTECGMAPYTCTEVTYKAGTPAFEVMAKGVWKACAKLPCLAAVEGDKHAVALPAELVDVLRCLVQNGRTMGLSVIAEILACFVEGSRCYIKR
ncbi:hypothetical protein LTR36_007832 [Oleoguttula mirabilis]|uniref:SAP domain-containing protein n=1 Tax=Oleoguttula mirabilis TaxID=1507867 RepID=A0AAV9J9Y1_9PEZI|nr:hypothetical protein LTR36_007832 [Oleoguttula mirabilis]